MLRPWSTRAPSAAALICSALACSPSALPAGHSLEHTPLHPAENSVESVSDPEGTTSPPARPGSETAPRIAVPDDRPTPVEPMLVIPKVGKEYGPEGPLALEELSSRGHWLAYCQPTRPTATLTDSQARAGSMPSVALVLAWADRTQAIDALLRVDPQGRYVVVLIQQKAWLLDALEDRRWDLSVFDPDLRFDGLSEHRSFAFTDHSLLILTNQTNPSGVRAIDLASLNGDQPPTSMAIRVTNDDVVYRLEATGTHAYTVALPPGSTTRYWPAGAQKLPQHRCLRQGQRFDAFGRLSAVRPDPFISYHWLYLPGPVAQPASKATIPASALEPAPGFLFGFQNGWLRRLDDGRLMLVRGKTQKQVSSARCGGRVLHADESSGRFVIACEEYEPTPKAEPPRKKSAKKPPVPPKYRFELYVIEPGHVVNLHAEVGRTGVDVHGASGQRYMPLRPGAAAALVDFKQARLHTLEGDAKVLGQGSAGVLIRRGNALTLWPGPGRPELPLEHRAETWAEILEKGSIVSVAARLFDLTVPLRTWTIPQSPLAITETGHALYARRAPQLGVWAQGPFTLVPPPSLLPTAPQPEALSSAE